MGTIYIDGQFKSSAKPGIDPDTLKNYTTKELVDKKVDKELGKGLSEANYTKSEKLKLSGIADNANNYVHPTSDGNLHVPAIGTTNNGKVLKAGATAGSLIWGTDNDTITTINGKTGVITKADIVALGIPAQDTVYTHPAGTNPHGTTKADVGLGNVDNTSDANKPVSTAQQTALNAKMDSSKFQVVESLPASPVSGTFYFVKE